MVEWLASKRRREWLSADQVGLIQTVGGDIMNAIDYDDPAVDERWCNARRNEVIQYLAPLQLEHGAIGECPAWHIAPYVSIWAIESRKHPGWVGWWVICGDLPTDYISAESAKHPREVLRAFGQCWLVMASYMSRGETYPNHTIGSLKDWPVLSPLLLSRAKILLEWANLDELWDEE